MSSKRKFISQDLKSSLPKLNDYITYGLEWETSVLIEMPKNKKSLIDREVIFKNGKIKFTSEGIDDSYKIKCEETDDIKEINKKIIELEEKIPISNDFVRMAYQQQIENLKKLKLNDCNCRFNLEAQLGVFNYSKEDSQKDIEDFNKTCDIFVQTVEKISETSELSGYPLTKSVTTYDIDKCKEVDEYEKFKDCSLSQKGVNYKLDYNGMPYECGYFQKVDDFLKTANISSIIGKPQMTVGVSLKYIPKIYLLYSLYDKNSNTESLYNLSENILEKSGIKDLSLTNDEYLTLLGFMILMVNYSIHFFYQKPNDYFKMNFNIKLRTNPASLYESLSLKLKNVFPMILEYLKKEIEDISKKINTGYYYKELLDFLQEEGYYSNNGFSDEFLEVYVYKFGYLDLLYKKLLIITTGKHKMMYFISKFRENVVLPEGIQDRSLYDIEDFEKRKSEYSIYFDITDDNVKLVPAINFQYNLYDKKTNRFFEDKQNTLSDPLLYLDKGFVSKTSKSKVIPKLMFKKDTSRLGVWEWPQFEKDFVHVEFRNYYALYRISQMLDLFSKNISDQLYDTAEIGVYLSIRQSTIFILENFFGEILNGENNESAFKQIMDKRKQINITKSPIFDVTFSFFGWNVILFTLNVKQLLRITTILNSLYQINGEMKMTLFKQMVDMNMCRRNYGEFVKPCNFINYFLGEESDEDIIDYMQRFIDKIYRLSLLFGDIFDSPINFADDDLYTFFQELTSDISDQDLESTRLFLDRTGYKTAEDKLKYIKENLENFKIILYNIDYDKRLKRFLKTLPIIGRII